VVIATTPAPAAPAGGPTSRPSGPRRRPGEFGGGGRKFTPRRKVCAFCVDKIQEVDYKDLARLRRFLSERGKIEPRRKTGTCAAHQRSLNVALKRARELAMLPFTAEHIRVTGVLVREPGAPPWRGARSRPAEEAPAEGATAEVAAPEAEASAAPAATPSENGTPTAATSENAAPAAAASENGTPAAAGSENGAPAAAPSPDTVAESSAAQGAQETPTSGPAAQES
jgi:small subunit ribosomal protein S18